MLKQEKQYSIGFRYDSDLNLIALKGCGVHYIDTHDYQWENRIRTDDFCLVQYCLSGCGELEYQGIHYTLNPGDLFLVDIPSQSRYFLPENSTSWEVCYLEFSKECLPLLHKIHSRFGIVLHLSPDSKTAKEVVSIFVKAYGQQILSYFDNTKLAYNFWIDLLQEINESETFEIGKIDYVKDYIDQHYDQHSLSLDSLADQFSLSKYYICKAFKKRFEVSIGKYLRDVRIDHACRLLLSCDDSTIEQIAQKVGYTNSNYFGKVFKKQTGLTPDVYRRQNAHYDQIQRLFENPHLSNSKQSGYSQPD